MRALILIAAIVALAACGNNDQTDNNQNVDENLTAENIVSNDVTAIDAVTGDAANMAADSDVNDIGPANASENDDMTAPSSSAPRHGAARRTTSNASSNVTDVASNAGVNAAE